jgi:hypothetical protein
MQDLQKKMQCITYIYNSAIWHEYYKKYAKYAKCASQKIVCRLYTPNFADDVTNLNMPIETGRPAGLEVLADKRD